FRLVNRQEMDIADPASVERAIAEYRPWAIINAGGYVRVDDAEQDVERCFRENALGPSLLAIACIRHRVQLLTFSSDLVFDGRQNAPYVETDPVFPLNVYGRSKVEAERRVLDTHPEALVVRTSAFFGPWDSHNFLTQALNALRSGAPFVAANDTTVSPTYVPDLVHACLDLLIDREKGVWHLTNGEPVTWLDLACKTASMANVDTSRLEARSCLQFGHAAQRPLFSALGTEKAIILPQLDDAISRYLRLRAQADEEDFSGQAARVGHG
ncbi:MAG TPA: SDR family oxidoreductase, partial [Noviherbaspirillum sp.]|nr:SDR family oxidoreductase [Noviherbaspirillum sp.]